MKTKCSPKIAKKFTPLQLKMWNAFYETFNDDVNLPPMKFTKEQVSVIAHNMACQSVWLLDRVGVIRGKKKTTTLKEVL